jgi:hypothetical protein
MLKSWRVGTDAIDACVKLVERAERKMEDEGKKIRKGKDYGP